MTRPWAVSQCLAALAAVAASRRGSATSPAAPTAIFDIPVRPEHRSAMVPSVATSPVLASSRPKHRTASAPRNHLTLTLAAALSLFFQPAHAQTYDWGAMAIVSGTMGVNANRLCIGEATRGDIGCPDYAPSVTTAGLEVSGTVSATRFVGDGSGLTGIAAAGTFASLTDVSYSALGRNIFGPGSLTGANAGVTDTTVLGAGSLSDPGNTGYRNTVVGALSLPSNTSGYRNTVVGANSMVSNTTGYRNVAVGDIALRLNMTGNQNIAIGSTAMSRNTNGSGNSAIGAGALQYNTTAGENIGVGGGALFYNGDGARNVAVGYLTGGGGGSGDYATVSNSVFVGWRSGYVVSGSQANTMLGYRSGYTVTSGNSNTLVGYDAGNGITTGNNNVVIGAGLNPYSFTGSNQLNLGDVLFGDLGNGSTLQGKLGINVTSPTIALEVSGSVTFNTGILQVSTAQVNPLNLIRSNGNAVLIKISNTDGLFYMGMDPNENFGIGPTPNMTNASGLPYLTVARTYQVGLGVLNPSQTLHVSGTVITTSWTGINFSSSSKVTPTAPLEVSGTVSATRFVGDGSGLTGIAGTSSDRIVSTSANVVAGNGGTISITTGGVSGTAYFDTVGRLVTPGISTTGVISATGLYVTGTVGIGTSTPAATLDVVGTSPNSGSVRVSYNSGNGNVSFIANRYTPANDAAILFRTNGTNIWKMGLTDTTRVTSSSDFTLLDSSNNDRLHILASNGYVGIGVVTPTARLEVSGTVSATTLQLVNGPPDSCSTANGGALKRVGNRFYFCRP